MTSYRDKHQIYSESLREALASGKTEAEVLIEIRQERAEARALRAEARKPGFLEPVVSYIPAYGTEAHVRALLDYCRLRRMATRSEAFALWLTEMAAPERVDSDRDLLIWPRHRCRYPERPDEPYMSPQQLDHFRHLLKVWRFDLETSIKEQGDRWRMRFGLRPIEPDAGLIFEAGIGDHERKVIEKIEAALKRIDQGSFGYCSVTGKPIGIERLESRPIETICTEARELIERKNVEDWRR